MVSQNPLDYVNWRMAFIFLPAIIRGEWKQMGLYTPFMFSHVLASARSELFRMTAEGLKSNWKATLWTVVQMTGFAAFVWYFEAEGRYLPSFFFSSFVCPSIRHYFPQNGDRLVYGLILSGLLFAWLWQGIDSLFLGFFFLQGVPEVQRHLWFKPKLNILCISGVTLLMLPYTSLGFVHYWVPQYLPIFPTWYLQILCHIANAYPSVVDHYLTLGLEPGANQSVVGSTYRKLARQYHPDKIPKDTPEAERLVRTEKFRQIAEANDVLSRADKRAEYDELRDNPELKELGPRSTAALFLMFYWVLHMLIDFVEIEQAREKSKEMLRKHIRDGEQETQPLNLKALGLEGRRNVLVDYVSNDDNDIPFVQHNNLENILEFRELLEYAGYELDPLPEGLEEHEPLILPPPRPQPQQPQVPGWIMWLEQPEQADNVLTLAYKGKEKELKEKLSGKEPASPHAMITPGDRSAVYLAAMNGHAKCITILKDKGANVCYPDENGFAPLHVASQSGHLAAVKALVKAMPPQNVMQYNKGQMLPIHMAALGGHIDIIEFLCKAGSKVNVVDADNETPLYYAAKADRADAIEYFAKAGVDVDACNKSNMTPLWIASVCGCSAAVAKLHSLNADASKVPTKAEPAIFNGMTPLQAAEQAGRGHTVALLKELDALKDEVEAAKEAYGVANKAKAPKEEQKACLNVLKKARNRQKLAYDTAAMSPEDKAKAIKAFEAKEAEGENGKKQTPESPTSPSPEAPTEEEGLRRRVEGVADVD